MIPGEPFVHVGGPDRECAPAIVLRAGQVSLVRIFRPTPIGVDPGLADEEGDVRNWREARWVPNPGYDYEHPTPVDRFRLLDSWHYAYECHGSPELIHYPPVPDGYQLDATPEVVP